MNSSLTNRQMILYLLVILISGFVIGSVSLTYPFGRDQGTFAYTAKLILHGKLVYKDVFDIKPPAVHYAYALGQLIFGESMMGMRIFDIVWESLTGFLIFLIAFRITSNRFASLFSAVLYIFLYYRLDYWHTLQADGLLNLPFAFSILFLISKESYQKSRPYFLSGVCFGIVLLFKYTTGIFLVMFAGAVAFKGDVNLRQKSADILKYAAGLVIVVLLVFGYYFAKGALGQLLDILLKQIPLYADIGYDKVDPAIIANNVIRLFTGSVYSPLILFSCLSLIYLIVKRQITFNHGLIFIWFAASILNLIIQWKFFLYHFLVIIPPLAIGAAIFFSELNKFFGKNRVAAYSSISILLIAYVIFAEKPYNNNLHNMYGLLSGKRTLQELYMANGTTADSVFMFGKTFRAVDYIKSNTSREDKIYVWGFDPLVYYFSGRMCCSRFIYNTQLCWKGNNGDIRKEFISELNSGKPKMILVAQKDPMPEISGYNEDSKQLLEKFPDFKKILNDDYAFDTLIEDFYYYKLKKQSSN